MNLSDKKSSYTVSAVIPAYNASEHIGRAIESVLAQTRPADEIIVVDDGSTDTTRNEVAKFGNRIKYIYQENAGAGAARNTGTKAAQMQWIAFLDADDEWVPKKLELQIDNLKKNPDLVWAYGNMNNCWCKENKFELARQPDSIVKALEEKEYFESYLHAFGQGNFASTINLIIKRDIIVEVGYFAEDQKRAQDTDMWLRIAYRWPKIGYVNEPLAIYHRGVEGSITKTHTHSKIIGDLVARHLNLSAEQGKLEDFQPCGSKMLQVWMREVILHQHRSKEVLDLVERFKDILPFRFKNEMRLRTRYPRLAPYCLGFSNRVKQIISRFKNRQ